LAENNFTNYGQDMSGVTKLAEALKENHTLVELKCAAPNAQLPYLAG
jgi:hypothetical protein